MKPPNTTSLLSSDSYTLLVSTRSDQLSRAQRSTYTDWLDGSELARYQRMARQETADCFLTCRAVVRQVIADTLGSVPEHVMLTISPTGKPEYFASAIGSDPAPAAIHFSITHKSSAIVIVFSSAPIGVDLETVSTADTIAVARRFFTSMEADYLQTLGSAARKLEFTRIWVLKEAEVKRQGSTLAQQMAKIAFRVEGESICCQGNSGSGHYQLYQMNSNHKAGYIAIAGSPGFAASLFAVQGLPLAGYSYLPLTMVAESISPGSR